MGKKTEVRAQSSKLKAESLRGMVKGFFNNGKPVVIDRKVKSKGLKLKAQRKEASSVLWTFIQDMCDIGRDKSVNVKELYDRYRYSTPSLDKIKPLLSFKDFEEELKKALPFIGKEKRRPERRMYFTGIRLKAHGAERMAQSVEKVASPGRLVILPTEKDVETFTDTHIRPNMKLGEAVKIAD